MQVTVLGHASLWIESVDQRILIDPVLDNTLAGGDVTYAPGRLLDHQRLPAPTLLVVTHGHFDHFHRPSLRRLRERFPRLPVVAPADKDLLAGLERTGFEEITVVAPWQELVVGRTALRPTPSEHDEPEFGLVVDDRQAVLWHMADGEVAPAVGERVHALHGRVDVVSCKYQPVADASVNYLWGLGSSFDATEVAGWLESACRADPVLAFPYASGLCFTGRHAWFNRYAFPFSAEEIADLLGWRLGEPSRAAVVLPGDVLAFGGGRVEQRRQASPFVRVASSPEVHWEPIEAATLAAVPADGARERLRTALERVLTTGFAGWLSSELTDPRSPIGHHLEAGVVWQLVVHAGPGERWGYAVDFRAERPSLARGHHPRANYVVHLSGAALAEVLDGTAPPQLFWLAGAGRIYQKVLAVRDGRVVAPAWTGHRLLEALPDPFTFYLRRRAGGGH